MKNICDLKNFLNENSLMEFSDYQLRIDNDLKGVCYIDCYSNKILNFFNINKFNDIETNMKPIFLVFKFENNSFNFGLMDFYSDKFSYNSNEVFDHFCSFPLNKNINLADIVKENAKTFDLSLSILNFLNIRKNIDNIFNPTDKIFFRMTFENKMFFEISFVHLKQFLDFKIKDLTDIQKNILIKHFNFDFNNDENIIYIADIYASFCVNEKLCDVMLKHFELYNEKYLDFYFRYFIHSFYYKKLFVYPNLFFINFNKFASSLTKVKGKEKEQYFIVSGIDLIKHSKFNNFTFKDVAMLFFYNDIDIIFADKAYSQIKNDFLNKLFNFIDFDEFIRYVYIENYYHQFNYFNELFEFKKYKKIEFFDYFFKYNTDYLYHKIKIFDLNFINKNKNKKINIDHFFYFKEDKSFYLYTFFVFNPFFKISFFSLLNEKQIFNLIFDFKKKTKTLYFNKDELQEHFFKFGTKGLGIGKININNMRYFCYSELVYLFDKHNKDIKLFLFNLLDKKAFLSKLNEIIKEEFVVKKNVFHYMQLLNEKDISLNFNEFLILFDALDLKKEKKQFILNYKK